MLEKVLECSILSVLDREHCGWCWRVDSIILEIRLIFSSFQDNMFSNLVGLLTTFLLVYFYNTSPMFFTYIPRNAYEPYSHNFLFQLHNCRKSHISMFIVILFPRVWYISGCRHSCNQQHDIVLVSVTFWSDLDGHSQH